MTTNDLSKIAGATADELSAVLRGEHVTVMVVLTGADGTWVSATRGDGTTAADTLRAVADDVESEGVFRNNPRIARA